MILHFLDNCQQLDWRSKTVLLDDFSPRRHHDPCAISNARLGQPRLTPSLAVVWQAHGSDGERARKCASDGHAEKESIGVVEITYDNDESVLGVHIVLIVNLRDENDGSSLILYGHGFRLRPSRRVEQPECDLQQRPLGG